MLTCFVASAFGHNDVDKIFDDAITPVLQNLGIKVLRVDRSEHNDDIDNKIQEFMAAADFCIADLTYARPSAYFEAGHMEGSGKPVIYLARSDHFRPQPGDNHGNLRVHFDLQMRNVLTWSSPCKTFKKRLGSRVRFVTRPLRNENIAKELLIQERKEFAVLSVPDKILAVNACARKLLAEHGFAAVDEGERRTANEKRNQPFRHRRDREPAALTMFNCRQAFMKSDLEAYGWTQIIDHLGLPSVHFICVAFANAPSTRLESALPTFNGHSHSLWLRWCLIDQESRMFTVHFIPGIKSVTDLRNKLDSVMEWVDLGAVSA